MEVAPPEQRSAKTYPREKKRVWGKNPPRQKFAYQIEPQVIEGQWENAPRSTKPVSGVLYYGYRYYSPGMGRWINRDPIEEQGGINLYAMVSNNTINRIDMYGLAEFSDCSTESVSLAPISKGFNVFGKQAEGSITFSASREVCKCCDGEKGEFIKSVSGGVDASLALSATTGQLPGNIGWYGLRFRGSLDGSGSLNGSASDCSGGMEYSVDITIGGSVGVDAGGEVNAHVGWFDITAGLTGNGTVSFTGWTLSLDCDDENGCENPTLQSGGIGGSIGFTASLGTKSISKSWDASTLLR